MANSQKQKNIQIPFSLFNDIVEFMEYLDVSNWDILFQDMHFSIMERIRSKQDSMALRENYSAIVFAKDEDSQHDARMHYLQMKRIYKS